MKSSDNLRLQGFFKALLRLLLGLFFLLGKKGTAKVPQEGGILLAANHASFLDPLFIGTACPRQVRFMARDSLFRRPGLGGLIAAVGAFPVKRDGVSVDAFRKALELLDAGRVVLVFPEGTRSYDGSVGPFKTGISMLAERAGVPVVPVAVAGSWRAWPRNRALPRPARVRVSFGEPITYSGQGHERFADELRSRVTDMMGAA